MKSLRAGLRTRLLDVPMRRKLYSAIAAAVGVAVAVAAAAVAIYEYRTFRPRTLEHAETQAGIMAELLVAPMLFHDPGTTEAYLATLRHWPELSAAVLYDEGWRLQARYTRDAAAPGADGPHPRPGAAFGMRSLVYVLPVMDAGRRLGYLAFHIDLPPLLSRLPQYGIMLAVVSLSLLAVSALLAFALKYAVTAPLTALAATAKSVTQNRDYSLRAVTGGRDEVGDLTRAFNQMLGSLEDSDRSLRESRHLLQSVIDSSAALIFVKDLEGRYLLINRRFEEIFGVSNEAVQGRVDDDLFSPERAEAYRAGDLRALLAGSPVEIEDIVDLADGRHLYVTVKSPLRDAAGNPFAICGVATDITPIKAYEEQLRQSQKMEAIGRLAGGISHDFNNLLTAINGYAALALQETPREAHSREYLEEILRAGERAAGLTRQLLAYSRKQMLEGRPWNLNEIVADMERMLRPLIGEDVRLATRLAADLGTVRVDRGQVEQIVLNLAINARDAMPEGGRLAVETRNVVLDEAYAQAHRDVVPGPHVLLSVSDTGTGMTPEVMAQIFEPFFTTKEVGKGTGLGLSVVFGIVKQSGGSIAVDSEPGKGSVFRVYFPQVAESGQAGPGAGESEEMPEEGKRGKREEMGGVARDSRDATALLLVEDEEQVRSFARLILENAGYAVHEAASGAQALDILASDPGRFGLIISDVVMPELGGPALAEALRSRGLDIPILFISGYTDAAPAEPPSGEAFLRKPFSPAELARKVAEILDRARSRRNGQ